MSVGEVCFFKLVQPIVDLVMFFTCQVLGTYQEDPANSGEFPAFVKEDKHLYFLKVSLFSSMEAWNIHSTLFTVNCAMYNMQCAMDDTFIAHWATLCRTLFITSKDGLSQMT